VGVGWSVKGEEWLRTGSSDRCRPFGGAQRRRKVGPIGWGRLGTRPLTGRAPTPTNSEGFSEPQPSHRQSSEPSGNT